MIARPILLDAAMGTALQARGLSPAALPEVWLAERPQEIEAVHASHAAAGARLLLTCTFNCTVPRLEPHGLAPRLEILCAAACRLARSAGPGRLVAGNLGPTGLVRPGRTAPSLAELRGCFERPFRALRAAGVDLLWTETHYALDEARAALAEGRRTDLPVAVTMAFAEADGRLRAPDGTPADECLRALALEGAAAVGLNCVAPSAAVAALVGEMASDLEVPIALKPNAGTPATLLAPEAFAGALAQALRLGVQLVGGCCGTSADHLRALRPQLLG